MDAVLFIWSAALFIFKPILNMFSKTSHTIPSFCGENFVPFNLSGGVQGVGKGDHVGKTPSGKEIEKIKSPSWLPSFSENTEEPFGASSGFMPNTSFYKLLKDSDGTWSLWRQAQIQLAAKPSISLSVRAAAFLLQPTTTGLLSANLSPPQVTLSCNYFIFCICDA